jgi:hypothetical protein
MHEAATALLPQPHCLQVLWPLLTVAHTLNTLQVSEQSHADGASSSSGGYYNAVVYRQSEAQLQRAQDLMVMANSAHIAAQVTRHLLLINYFIVYCL